MKINKFRGFTSRYECSYDHSRSHRLSSSIMLVWYSTSLLVRGSIRACALIVCLVFSYVNFDNASSILVRGSVQQLVVIPCLFLSPVNSDVSLEEWYERVVQVVVLLQLLVFSRVSFVAGEKRFVRSHRWDGPTSVSTSRAAPPPLLGRGPSKGWSASLLGLLAHVAIPILV